MSCPYIPSPDISYIIDGYGFQPGRAEHFRDAGAPRPFRAGRRGDRGQRGLAGEGRLVGALDLGARGAYAVVGQQPVYGSRHGVHNYDVVWRGCNLTWTRGGATLNLWRSGTLSTTGIAATARMAPSTGRALVSISTTRRYATACSPPRSPILPSTSRSACCTSWPISASWPRTSACRAPALESSSRCGRSPGRSAITSCRSPRTARPAP